MNFRSETHEDQAAIREVVTAAFQRADEARLVDALRSGGGLVFSAVATVDTQVVGHVGFSAVAIGSSEPGPSVLALAPVAVAPEHQRKGIGSGLIRWSLAQCAKMGCEAVLVLGEPEYYHRFGFVPASRYQITCPYPAPDDAFMALELTPDALRNRTGMVRYREEFSVL